MSLRRTVGACIAAFAATLVLAAAGHAAEAPYDEAADAPAAVAAAVTAAAAQGKHVLVVFGANWCPDCRTLDREFKRDRTAALLGQHFVVVKVDVGRFDKNQELSRRYGDPIRKGIPAVVVLGRDGQAGYATRAGELADARHMGSEAIEAFFEDVVTREHL